MPSTTVTSRLSAVENEPLAPLGIQPASVQQKGTPQHVCVRDPSVAAPVVSGKGS